MTPRSRWLFAFCGAAVLFLPFGVSAYQEKEIRIALSQAEQFERQAKWEEARQIYEILLSRDSAGLRIRDRYNHVMRRCWQSRRHNDPSYLKEVLSIDFGQAMRICTIINNTLLDGSVEKKKLDPTKLFNKGLQELDFALSDAGFIDRHIPADKRGQVEAFRAAVRKQWGAKPAMSRQEAAKQIREIADAAELHLGLSGVVVAMEMACGACYAIDEYTVYLTPNELRVLAQTLSQTEAVGVGLVLTIRDTHIVVQAIVPDSPAHRSDEIFINDQIVSVNKKAIADLPLNQVRSMLEGPTNSVVEIELLSPGMPNTRTVMLARQRPQNVDVQPFYPAAPNTSIGVLRINQFSDATATDVDEAINRLTMQAGAKALIIDLRGNPGGIFDSAIETAERFLSAGNIIASALNQDTNKPRIYHAKNKNAITIPVAVLVDSDTASAAEVLAGALKDNERAIVIGQKTFGKGCTQRVLKLPNGAGGVPTGGMKMTVERFFSPKNVAYSGRGVVPHIIVDDQAQFSQANNGDPSMMRAVQELNRILGMPK